MLIPCSTHTHFECDGHTVHMPTRRCLLPPVTSTVKSSLFTHMCIAVHSAWLPGYADVTQTVLIILTVAGLFPDRPCIFVACRKNSTEPTQKEYLSSPPRHNADTVKLAYALEGVPGHPVSSCPMFPWGWALLWTPNHPVPQRRVTFLTSDFEKRNLNPCGLVPSDWALLLILQPLV